MIQATRIFHVVDLNCSYFSIFIYHLFTEEGSAGQWREGPGYGDQEDQQCGPEPCQYCLEFHFVFLFASGYCRADGNDDYGEEHQRDVYITEIGVLIDEMVRVVVRADGGILDWQIKLSGLCCVEDEGFLWDLQRMVATGSA